MPLTRPAVLALLVLAMATGCGPGREASREGERPEPAREPSGAGTPLSTTPPPTLSPRRGPGKGPSDQVDPITVSGRVSADGPCRHLVTGTVRWTLLGAQTDGLEDGAEVELVGRPARHLLSPCGDSLLQVLRIRRR
jgi:hypothetical protein